MIFWFEPQISIFNNPKVFKIMRIQGGITHEDQSI
jgi:hypothetical protein